MTLDREIELTLESIQSYEKELKDWQAAKNCALTYKMQKSKVDRNLKQINRRLKDLKADANLLSDKRSALKNAGGGFLIQNPVNYS